MRSSRAISRSATLNDPVRRAGLASGVFVAVALAILGAPAAKAQSVAPAAGDIGFLASEQAGEMSHSSLVGLKIKNPAGAIIGDINYLVLDAKGQVTTIVVGVGGVLGLGEKNVGVPFGKFTLKPDANRNMTATLDTTLDALRAAPAYKWTEKSTAEVVKEKAKGWSDKAQEKAKDWSEKAQEKAKDWSEKAQDKAKGLSEKAKEMTTDKPADAKK